jgi:hypothetical protein
MKQSRISRRRRALIECAPITEAVDNDRAMLSALKRAKTVNAEELERQQNFDRAIGWLYGCRCAANKRSNWRSACLLRACQQPGWNTWQANRIGIDG